MSLVEHAERELRFAFGEPGESDETNEWMREALLEMVNTFSSHGHSGSTAMAAIGMLERLLRFLPLTPLEDRDEDWVEVADNLFQHRRCSKVFKNSRGEAWQIDYYYKVDECGNPYTDRECTKTISFPYVPPLTCKPFPEKEVCGG